MIPDIFNDLDIVKKIKEVRVGGPEKDYSCEKIKSWLNAVKGQGKTIVYETDSSKVHKHDFCSQTEIDFEIAVGDQSSSNKNERGMVMKMTCPTCKFSFLFFSGGESSSLLFPAWRHGRSNSRQISYSISRFFENHTLQDGPSWS